MSRAIVAGEPSRHKRMARALVPPRLRPRLFGTVRSVRHRGNAVYCSCCDGEFSSFIAHRGIFPGRCPRCGSRERHRLLIDFAHARTDLFTEALSVLHVAPEYGLQRRLRRSSNLIYRSADLDSALAMDHVDLLDMPYPDGSFDVVICSHVLEHVADDRIALSEIRRVLTPEGRAILMSPIDEELAETLEDPSVVDPAERDRVFGQSDHLRRYGRNFASCVATAGFAVDVVSHIDRFSPGEIARQGLRRDSTTLFRNDDIFICRRAESSDGGSVERVPPDYVSIKNDSRRKNGLSERVGS
ncbi:MAG TPA: methyltransferase domain-containing protein [Solirubrobacteraceae bacterium]|nr:methyltransferase domain-containing protein [Solirubrobacteraceae bacterium]